MCVRRDWVNELRENFWAICMWMTWESASCPVWPRCPSSPSPSLWLGDPRGSPAGCGSRPEQGDHWARRRRRQSQTSGQIRSSCGSALAREEALHPWGHRLGAVRWCREGASLCSRTFRQLQGLQHAFCYLAWASTGNRRGHGLKQIFSEGSNGEKG